MAWFWKSRKMTAWSSFGVVDGTCSTTSGVVVALLLRGLLQRLDRCGTEHVRHTPLGPKLLDRLTCGLKGRAAPGSAGLLSSAWPARWGSPPTGPPNGRCRRGTRCRRNRSRVNGRVCRRCPARCPQAPIIMRVRGGAQGRPRDPCPRWSACCPSGRCRSRCKRTCC